MRRRWAWVFGLFRRCRDLYSIPRKTKLTRVPDKESFGDVGGVRVPESENEGAEGMGLAPVLLCFETKSGLVKLGHISTWIEGRGGRGTDRRGPGVKGGCR